MWGSTKNVEELIEIFRLLNDKIYVGIKTNKQ